MAAITINQSTTIGGISFSGIQTIEEEGELALQVTLAAAKAGTLSTRTDANTGIATLGSGHGITTGNKCDVFWTVGGVDGKRLNMDVSATDSTTVSLDGGTGDDFPAQASSIVVSPVTDLSAVVTGNNVAAIAISCQKESVVRLRGSSTDHLTQELDENGVFIWATGNGTNPVSGDSIDTARVSNKDSANANRVRVGILYSAA